MLVDIRQLPQETEEQKATIIGYAITNVIAIDPETQAELHCSHAHRKLGRPTRYHVRAFDGTTLIHHFRTGTQVTKCQSRVCGLTAYSDTEAIEKANRVLAKKYAWFMQEVYKEEVKEYHVS